jgi:hypothetical protein
LLLEVLDLGLVVRVLNNEPFDVIVALLRSIPPSAASFFLALISAVFHN